ncbi:MAG: hypothetical protein ABIG93_04365 [archaeon]|nr:hypothetical protein [Nanoarchaeota archaeon]
MNNQKTGLNSPAYMTVSPINIDGELGQRLMTVYRTVGCEYDKKGKGCTMCDFAHYSNPEVNERNIETQHRQSLETLRNMDFIHFDMLTLGNFYNDREISPNLRESLLESLAEVKGVKRVLTEARRQYITTEKLAEAKSCLREDQTLEYALGYETVNPDLRNEVLRKGTPEFHLDEALEMCSDAGVDFVSYVLIKPHTLSEAEGIEEAVNTATHVLAKAEKYGVKARIAFEPVFVTKGKIIEELWENGEYRPPQLWSVAEVLIQTAELLGMENTQGKLFVGLSDENLSRNRMSSNCGSCDDEVRGEIQAFNGHQEVSKLRDLYHECKDEWRREVGGEER